MARTILLIRHGETDWNAQKRYMGASDIPLNSVGRQQARAIIQTQEIMSVGAVYASPRYRAIETAAIVFPKVRIQTKNEFSELHFGAFEGLTWQEIEQAYPIQQKTWMSDVVASGILGGESLQDLAVRVRAGLAIVAKDTNDICAIVTHAGPIRTIICDCLSMELERFWSIECLNASITIIEQKQGTWVLRNTKEPYL